MNDKIERAKKELAQQKVSKQYDQDTLHTDQVSFYHAYKMFWRQGKMMNGFTSRHNFWYMFTWQWLIRIIMFIFAALLGGVGVLGSLDTSRGGHTDMLFFGLMFAMFILIGGYTLLVWVPMLTMTMRRYKDIGLNRFWGMLMYLVLSIFTILYFFLGGTGQTVISYLFIILDIGNLIICSLPKGQLNDFDE